VIALDIVLDEDPHYRGFNLTANGPQETARRRAWDTAAAGPQAGEMFQALEVHCGLVKPGSRCEVLQKEQIVSADGKSRAQGFSLTENVTYCNDSTYASSDSPMQEILNMSDGFFRNGLMSQVCTRNENGTEIYNVTAYNYSCLPPCTPTLFTYQVLAEGCIYNCTNQRPDLDFMPECLNTYGLYPEEYLCVGGRYHGQHCLDLADIASCYDQEAKSSCERRDDMPGIQGPDPKAHFNKDDPSVFVRGVHYGDLHFVDWLHRGARVKWNEVATEVAAALGYMGILEYMLRNGAPWRRPAIEVARMRGRCHPPLPRTNRTSLVPPLVLSGHAVLPNHLSLCGQVGRRDLSGAPSAASREPEPGVRLQELRAAPLAARQRSAVHALVDAGRVVYPALRRRPLAGLLLPRPGLKFSRGRQGANFLPPPPSLPY
jgi:hypothetical protein